MPRASTVSRRGSEGRGTAPGAAVLSSLLLALLVAVTWPGGLGLSSGAHSGEPPPLPPSAAGGTPVGDRGARDAPWDPPSAHPGPTPVDLSLNGSTHLNLSASTTIGNLTIEG